MNKRDSHLHTVLCGFQNSIAEKKLSVKAPYLFCTFSVILLAVSMFVNRDTFHDLAHGSVVWYQIKQVLSLLLLFAVGYAFLKAIQHHLSELWICLLAFPTAICLWCFFSEFLLLADFTYRFWRVCFLMGAGILACYLFRRIRHIPLHPVLSADAKAYAGSGTDTGKALHACGNAHVCRSKSPLLGKLLTYGRMPAVVIGVCCLVSTGWNYIVLNYDSYFYFSDYGKALTLMMSYKDIVSDNSFVLTNIGQFLPLVSSYVTYWGLDSSAPVLGFLIINLYAAFGAAVYEQVRARFDAGRAAVYAGSSVLLLASCSVFFMYTHWVLSNTYILFYLFFLFYLGKEQWKAPSVDRAILIGLYALAVTMLRKDGLVIVCVVFICYSVRKLYSSWILALLFLPSAAYQFFYIYWLRHIIYAQTKTAFGTSLLSNNFMKLLLLGVAATFLYLLLLHFLAERVLKRYLPHAMTLFLIAALFYFMTENLTRSIDFIDAWLRNFGGVGFGFCILQILLLTTLVLLAPQFPKTDASTERLPESASLTERLSAANGSGERCAMRESSAEHPTKEPKKKKSLRYGYTWFFVLSNVLVTLIIYRQKGNTEVGIDNSGLRALYQIIPIFYYAAMTTIAPLFEKPLHGGHAKTPAQKK